jgi:Subtilase family
MFNYFKTASSRFFSRFPFLREPPWSYLTILALVGGAYFAIPRVFHSFGCEAKAQSSQLLGVPGSPPFSFYIDSQVIVIGTQADLQAVVVPLNLMPIEDCDLSYLNSRKAPNPDLTAAQRKTLVLQLYEIPAGSKLPDGNTATVESVVSWINANAPNKDTQKRTLFADPNYTISSFNAYGTCSLPNSGGGGGGGTAYGDPGGMNPYDPALAENSFLDQWALGNQGINLTNMTSSLDLTGRGVKVAVFDTSPYRIKVPSIIIRRNEIAFPPPLWYTTWDAAGLTVPSNHGLFVVGQIHRIAPKSRIRLIRVLNDDGCSELWVLHKALQDYISRMSFWTGRLDRTVINLSLGVEANQNAVFTLGQTLDDAYRLGAIIIAAAGNDSYASTNPLEMRYPAKYDNVIGVAAVDKNGVRSCYSNKGDVAAPGGTGGPDPITSEPCVPRADTWNQGMDCPGDMKNCKYGVISLIETRYGPRYVLWSGTSFAAPLVSGMAALAYEENDQKTVICLIHGGNSPVAGTGPLGTGVIDIRNLTSPTVLSLCP